MLEPRRIAARASAERMAKTLGERAGETVGYRVRFGSKVSRATKIEVVTEGHFLAADSRRSRTVRRRRGAVRRIPRALARCRSGAGAGARRAGRPARGSAHSRDVGDAGRRAGGKTARRCPGHIQRRPRLSGRDPLSRPQGRCAAGAADGGCDRDGAARRSGLGAGVPAGGGGNPPHPKFSRRANPRRVRSRSCRCSARSTPPCRTAPSRRRPKGQRKVVLATSIAETSLTIEGVRIVVDSGVARVPRYEPDIGLTRSRNRARLARRGRPAPRPRRPHRARRLLPAVGRAADRVARGLYPARNPFRRSVLAGARPRAMGRQRSRHAGVSRSAAGAGAEGGAQPARRTRRARFRRPDHRGRQEPARTGAAAAAGADDRGFAPSRRGRGSRRHRRRADRARPRRRQRRSRRQARPVPPRPLAARRAARARWRSAGRRRSRPPRARPPRTRRLRPA